MAIVTGDRYLDQLADFVDQHGEELLDGRLVLKLNPVGLLYLHSRLGELKELEDLKVNAPVDYLRAFITNLGDNKKLEKLCRVLQLLESLKVVSLTKNVRDPTPIKLLPFTRLRVLELRGCDLSTSNPRGLLELRPCLERLLCYDSASALDHILADRTKELEAALPWPRLTTLSCPENGMQVMDASLTLLPALQVLDLSRNRFAQVSNLNNCCRLVYLDLGFNGIKSVVSLNQMAKTLFNVTKVVLRSNALTCTRGLEELYRLEGLDLAFNLISCINEVARLGHLPNLKFLWFEGNPIAFLPSYRWQVSKRFHHPEKIVLDGQQLGNWRFGGVASRQEGESSNVCTDAETVPLLSDESRNKVASGLVPSSSQRAAESSGVQRDAEVAPVFSDESQNGLENGLGLTSAALTSGVGANSGASASDRERNPMKGAGKRRVTRLAEIISDDDESADAFTGEQMGDDEVKCESYQRPFGRNTEQLSAGTRSVATAKKGLRKAKTAERGTSTLMCLKGDKLLEIAETLKKDGGNAWLKAYHDFVEKSHAEETCNEHGPYRSSTTQRGDDSDDVPSGAVIKEARKVTDMETTAEEVRDGHGGCGEEKGRMEGPDSAREFILDSDNVVRSGDRDENGIEKMEKVSRGVMRDNGRRNDVCRCSRDVEERVHISGHEESGLLEGIHQGSATGGLLSRTYDLSGDSEVQQLLPGGRTLKKCEGDRKMVGDGESVGEKERREEESNVQDMDGDANDAHICKGKCNMCEEGGQAILHGGDRGDKKLVGADMGTKRGLNSATDCVGGEIGTEGESGNCIQASPMDSQACTDGASLQLQKRKQRQLIYGVHSNSMEMGISISSKHIQQTSGSMETGSAHPCQVQSAPPCRVRSGPPSSVDSQLSAVDKQETSSESSSVEWTDESETDEVPVTGRSRVRIQEEESEGALPITVGDERGKPEGNCTKIRRKKAGRQVTAGQKIGRGVQDEGECCRVDMEANVAKISSMDKAGMDGKKGAKNRSADAEQSCVGVKDHSDSSTAHVGIGMRYRSNGEGAAGQVESPSAALASGCRTWNERRSRRNRKHTKRIVNLSLVDEDENDWRKRIAWEVRLSSGAVVTATGPANDCAENSRLKADHDNGCERFLFIGLKNSRQKTYESCDVQRSESAHGVEELSECQQVNDPEADVHSNRDANIHMRTIEEASGELSCWQLQGAAVERVQSSDGADTCEKGGSEKRIGMETDERMLEQFAAPVENDAREDDIGVCFKTAIADQERTEECMMYWRCGYLRLWGPATKERDVLLLISTQQMLYFLNEESSRPGYYQTSYPVLRILASHCVGDVKRVVVGIGLQCLRLEIGIAASYLVVFRSASLTAEFIECITSACKSGRLQPRGTLEIASCEREQIEHMERELFGGKKTSIHFYAMLHCRFGQDKLWKSCSLILTSRQIVLCEEKLGAFGSGVCQGRDLCLQSNLSEKKRQQHTASSPAPKPEPYFTQLCSRTLNDVQRVESYEDGSSNVIRILFLPTASGASPRTPDQEEGSTSLATMVSRRHRLPRLFGFRPHREDDGANMERTEAKKSQKQMLSDPSKLSGELQKGGDADPPHPCKDEESRNSQWELRFSDRDSFVKLQMMVRAACKQTGQLR